MPEVSFKLGIVACDFQRTGVQEGRRSEQDGFFTLLRKSRTAVSLQSSLSYVRTNSFR
jgi:hypothetical protein